MPAAKPAQFLNNLTIEMHQEVDKNRQHLRDIWALPLPERVEKGHSLGPVKLQSLTDQGLAVFRHQTRHSQHSFCTLREGDLVRVTLDDPEGNGPCAIFLHDDGEEVTLYFRSAPTCLARQAEGYSLDPDFFDPTERFLAALKQLATTAHGQDKVLPVLMGLQESTISPAEQYEVTSALEDGEDPPLHASQVEAIANCVAAENFHLVQGPPGTGKTHVLAQVAKLLLERNHRLLVTGPTHRAIQNALSAIRPTISTNIPVIKIGGYPFAQNPAIPQHDSLAEAGLPDDEPYVIGATPYALWSSSSGLNGHEFDTVLCDESSQLTILTAALAMLSARRFLFFGDHRQLSPVRLGPAPLDEDEQSIFARLAKVSDGTMLTESWRLNEELAAWPSATFYNNQLTARHNCLLDLEPKSPHPALQETPSLVAITHRNDSDSVVSEGEAETAAELILDLLRGGLKPCEIAVITPFRAQAARIRGMVRHRSEFAAWDHTHLACDTVERLQGQERTVVIVSMVASHPAFIERRHDFLFQPQRLNVAVTRARKKTIILYSDSLVRHADRLSEKHHGAMTFCSLIEAATPLTDPYGQSHP